MNIKIDLVISATPELLNALQLLTSGKTASATAQTPIIALPENGEVKKTRAKKTEVVAPVETEAPTNEQIIEHLKSELTQEMIIADAVPKSKAGHKDKIKAKVTELGYESITDLQPSHFDEFWSFLQTIPKPA